MGRCGLLKKHEGLVMNNSCLKTMTKLTSSEDSRENTI